METDIELRIKFAKIKTSRGGSPTVCSPFRGSLRSKGVPVSSVFTFITFCNLSFFYASVRSFPYLLPYLFRLSRVFVPLALYYIFIRFTI